MYNLPDPRASWLQTPGDSPGRGQSHGEIIVFFSGKWWNLLSDYLKHNQIFESALCCARIGEMIISRNPNVGMTSTVGNGNFAPNGRIDRPQVKACAASTWSFCSCFTCRLRGDWPRWQNFGGGNVTRAWFRTPQKNIAMHQLPSKTLSSFRCLAPFGALHSHPPAASGGTGTKDVQWVSQEMGAFLWDCLFILETYISWV